MSRQLIFVIIGLIVLLWAGGHERIAAFTTPPAISSSYDRGFRMRPTLGSLAPPSLLSDHVASIDKNRYYRKTNTELKANIWNAGNNNKRNTEDSLTMDGREPSLEDFVVIVLPAFLTTIAFTFYQQTSATFHNFVDFASSNTWQAVDGGAYLSDLLIPALNGPVSTFVSLLFGSLSSMTLSNLYTRQITLANKFAKFVEDIRLFDLHLSYLPTDYQLEAKTSLRRYTAEVRKTFLEEISTDDMEVHRELRREEMEYLMSVLHEASEVESIHGRALDESYGALNRIIDRRSDMTTVYDQKFPVWHYGNLALLAIAICTVFFILTDRSALMFLGAFQLRTCWAILVGTISVLFCVIYDLNTPLQGVFQIVKQSDRVFLQEFVREKPESFMKKKKDSLSLVISK